MEYSFFLSLNFLLRLALKRGKNYKIIKQTKYISFHAGSINRPLKTLLWLVLCAFNVIIVEPTTIVVDVTVTILSRYAYLK